MIFFKILKLYYYWSVTFKTTANTLSIITHRKINYSVVLRNKNKLPIHSKIFPGSK